MAHIQHRLNQFGPEYQPTDHEVTTIEAAGFEDDSWSNNVCVSFIKKIAGGFLMLWADCPDPKDREENAPRFSLHQYDGDGAITDIVTTTDSLTEALEAAAKFSNEQADD